MIVLHTNTSYETRQVAAALADLAQPDDLMLLVGDLGAGKTTFTQGFAAALGVTQPVTSPTFTLASRYEGRLLVHHLDVFRLEQLDEALDLDLPELLDSGGVTLIEWGDVIRTALPVDYLEVALTFPDADSDAGDADATLEGTTERRITLRPVGPRWVQRQPALHAATTPWQAATC